MFGTIENMKFFLRTGFGDSTSFAGGGLSIKTQGMCQGNAGPAWRSGPQSLSPGDGDFIRNGTKLKRVELDR